MVTFEYQHRNDVNSDYHYAKEYKKTLMYTNNRNKYFVQNSSTISHENLRKSDPKTFRMFKENFQTQGSRKFYIEPEEEWNIKKDYFATNQKHCNFSKARRLGLPCKNSSDFPLKIKYNKMPSIPYNEKGFCHNFETKNEKNRFTYSQKEPDVSIQEAVSSPTQPKEFQKLKKFRWSFNCPENTLCAEKGDIIFKRNLSLNNKQISLFNSMSYHYEDNENSKQIAGDLSDFSSSKNQSENLKSDNFLLTQNFNERRKFDSANALSIRIQDMYEKKFNSLTKNKSSNFKQKTTSTLTRPTEKIQKSTKSTRPKSCFMPKDAILKKRQSIFDSKSVEDLSNMKQSTKKNQLSSNKLKKFYNILKESKECISPMKSFLKTEFQKTFKNNYDSQQNVRINTIDRNYINERAELKNYHDSRKHSSTLSEKSTTNQIYLGNKNEQFFMDRKVNYFSEKSQKLNMYAKKKISENTRNFHNFPKLHHRNFMVEKKLTSTKHSRCSSSNWFSDVKEDLHKSKLLQNQDYICYEIPGNDDISKLSPHTKRSHCRDILLPRKSNILAPQNSAPNYSHSENEFNRRFSVCSFSEWDIHSSQGSSSEVIPMYQSQSTCRLSRLTNRSTTSTLSTPDNSRCDLTSMPYARGTENFPHPEGRFQKFRKTLSLRLNKKYGRNDSPSRSFSRRPKSPILKDPKDFHSRASNIDNLEEDRMHFMFRNPLFRSSERGRYTDNSARDCGYRLSKCGSGGDSGDSGIEAAEIDNLTELNLNHFQTPNCDSRSSKILRRCRSEIKQPNPSFFTPNSKTAENFGLQYSTPQPVKPINRNFAFQECAEENIILKRTKATTHLRRSVSQPLDLDKSFQAQVSFIRSGRTGRIPDVIPVRTQRRRPSVGNLLTDEDSSEDEITDYIGSDNEEADPSRWVQSNGQFDDGLIYAEALWDHVSLDSDELVFKAGDLVAVMDSTDKDWWWGKTHGRVGWFPSSFVRSLVNQQDHEDKIIEDTEMEGLETQPWGTPRKLSNVSICQERVRSNVILEILTTERDYVKHLRDLVEGYLKQVRKRPDMFNQESISTIFGNIESLESFHAEFLEKLESSIECEQPHFSCIGKCFIENKTNFEIYSEYCNNHPSAVLELQKLYEDQRYVHFFEACRLLQQMIDISLDGFLLTPVQKICKYPLQLQELLKYTSPKHTDYAQVHGAVQAMKEVALLVNERRRRMECLEKIAKWQNKVEAWTGPDLLEDSSQLIHQGEVTKSVINKTSNTKSVVPKGVAASWGKEVQMFLFDHQIIYCKKDLLKRSNNIVYRGRINTDLSEAINVPEDQARSNGFQHAWKMHCLQKGKTYVFSCKSANDKEKWLQALKRERALVVQDEASGFVASEKQKEVARIIARNQRPKKPKIKRHNKGQMTYGQAQKLVYSNSNKEENDNLNILDARNMNVVLKNYNKNINFVINGQTYRDEPKKKTHWFNFRKVRSQKLN